MIEPVLKISNLSVSTKGAHEKLLLDSVTLEVGAGETVCVVGESGSGKSITSLSIMGLLPDGIQQPSGSIMLVGEELVGASGKRLRQLRASKMAMVFQEPMTALNPVRTIGWQIEEVLRIHTSLSKAERSGKVEAILNAVHMPDPEKIRNAYPHQLSGGQRQRVVISMALVLKPQLLIADEPTTALDVTTQRQILLLIKELQSAFNTAALFITHDFGVVADIADRIVVMKSGRVVEFGSRNEILSAPSDPYTRMLVSSVPSLYPPDVKRTAGDEVLRVSGLTKTYGSTSVLSKSSRLVKAVNNVDLEVRGGEILGIVGESGSGKSTVARCIVRLTEPTSGSIKIHGEEVGDLGRSSLRQLRRDFQIVFQDPYRSLNPRRRVGESLIEGLINYGVTRAVATQRINELLPLVGIDPQVINRFPHQFSGGQRQRICLARALALEPKLLVADEAVSALDVSVQAQILQLLEEIREVTGVGILFITHDLRVAAQICDRILVMQRGQVVESGGVKEILSHPRHEYTKKLIESAPGRNWNFQMFQSTRDTNKPHHAKNAE